MKKSMIRRIFNKKLEQGVLKKLEQGVLQKIGRISARSELKRMAKRDTSRFTSRKCIDLDETHAKLL